MINRSRHIFISIGLLLSASISFSQETSDQDEFSVVATTTFIADIASNIAGEKVKVVSLMPTGGDPHIYEPVPQDAQLLAKADLILKNGLLLEGWLSKVIDNSGTQAEILTVSDGIQSINSIEYHGAPDPHAWMDVTNGIVYAKNIRDALIRLMPNDKDYFNKQFISYKTQLSELDQWIKSEINSVPSQHRILITSHDAFRYFGNAYGLQVESILGTSTDADARIEDVNNLIAVIENTGVPCVFIESTINPKLIQQLATDQGIIIGGKLYADSLGDEESGADTYVSMMKQNTLVIVKGLLGKSESHVLIFTDITFLLVVLGLFIIALIVVTLRLKPQFIDGLSWKDYEVTVKGLSVSYDNKTVLTNIYLQLLPGHLYGVIGPNGAGKSTLFKSLLGLIEMDSGEILINNQEIKDIRKYIAYIPQKDEVDWTFPATVADVVMMGRYPHKKVFEKVSAKDKSIVKDAMEQLDIWELRQRQIGELSGGQQQRVFIARAMAQEAEIYLFDEPFVGVDVITEDKIMQVLHKLGDAGKTILVIHHDLAQVSEYFTDVIMINQRLVAAGPTSEVFNDQNIRATYSGKLVIFEKTDEHLRKMK